MNEKIVELIKELNCIVYEYDMNNLIYRNSSFILNTFITNYNYSQTPYLKPLYLYFTIIISYNYF